MGTTTIFAIEARAEFTPQELAEIQKYKLGKQIVYNSKTFEKHQEALKNTKVGNHDHPGMAIAGGAFAMGKTVFHAVAAKMSLVITIDSLQRGQRIECKDLDEVLEADDALDEACRAVRRYLNLASTFDGRDRLADYTTEEPTITFSQAPASGSLPPLATETYTPPQITDGSSAPQAAIPAPEPMHRSTFDTPSDATSPVDRLTYWFNSLTTPQKVGVIVGGLFVFYIIIQML